MTERVGRVDGGISGTASHGARRCLVCGGSAFTPMFRGVSREGPRPAAAPYRITHSSRALLGSIERCRACGLGVLHPELVARSDYVEGHDAEYAGQAEVRIRNADRLLRLLPPPAPGAALLDVGCAYGFLLAAARALGYRSVGIEVSQPASEYARQRYGAEVWTGLIEDAPFKSPSFDVVTLVDVIEHLTDPATTLAHVHRLLRPGGWLLILTPDLGSAVARLLGRHWWGLLDDHSFYFSRRTLPRFLEAHGFAIEQSTAFGRVFPLRHWIFKLSQYSAGVHGVLDRIARAAGVADVEIPLNLGDQVVCVARRV